VCINVTNGSHPVAGWKRRQGRPRKTWLQQVITDQDCDIDVIWSQAHDRSIRGDRYNRRWSGTAVTELVSQRGTTVERRSLADELSLSCARPVADG